MLTSRRIEILKAIIEEFIDTTEPVGSKTLQQKYHLSYSSATIRNEMAALEAENYLEKPHTSAGRVPSNKAYQFYCEHLMEKSVDEDVKYAISNIFDQKSMNIEEAIKESCSIISEMTNLASGILGPDASKQTLEHIQLIPVDEKTAVCVLITNVSHTEHKVFHFEEAISVDDIKKDRDMEDRYMLFEDMIKMERRDAMREGMQKGMQKGMQSMILDILNEKNILNSEIEHLVQSEADTEKLKQYNKAALHAGSAEEFLCGVKNI